MTSMVCCGPRTLRYGWAGSTEHKSWRSAHATCASLRAWSEGKAARGELLLSKAEAEGRDLGPVRGLRAVMLLERGRLRRALVEAERAIVLSPTEARGWYVRGRVRLERAAAGALADLQK